MTNKSSKTPDEELNPNKAKDFKAELLVNGKPVAMNNKQEIEDCWLWAGSINDKGYGYVGRHTPAHRVLYENMVGEIPEGLEIDHLCRVKQCVNPKHLEAVTHQENVRRGLRGQQQEYCRKGHKLSGDNIYSYYYESNGRHYRRCKTCMVIHDRNRYVKNRTPEPEGVING